MLTYSVYTCVYLSDPISALELLLTCAQLRSLGLYIHSLSIIIAPLVWQAFLNTEPCTLAWRDGAPGLD